MKKNLNLPEKPSELIRVALADLDKIEKTPGYEIVMSDWHVPFGGRCEVCLAGAVIASQRPTLKNEDLQPYHFPPATCGALEALNQFRMGFIEDGLCDMGIYGHRFKDMAVTPYKNDPAKFKRDLERIAKRLEKAGL